MPTIDIGFWQHHLRHDAKPPPSNRKKKHEATPCATLVPARHRDRRHGRRHRHRHEISYGQHPDLIDGIRAQRGLPQRIVRRVHVLLEHPAADWAGDHPAPPIPALGVAADSHQRAVQPEHRRVRKPAFLVCTRKLRRIPGHARPRHHHTCCRRIAYGCCKCGHELRERPW